MIKENLPPPFDSVAIKLNWKPIIENFKRKKKSQNGSVKTEFFVTLFILLCIVFGG